jgi:hypothetical protein
MRPSVLFITAALALPALGGAAAGTELVASPTPVVHAAAGTVLVTCDGASKVARPRAYVLACGDGNTSLVRLRWRDWGSATAHASGAIGVNLCEPDCADGKVREFPVTVTASQRRTGRYTRLVIHFTGARPPGARATATYTVNRNGPSVDG